MPTLKNAKHELFAQNLCKGMSATDAHEAAGYKRHDGNASTLANKPDIIARLEEIRGPAVEAAGLEARQVLDELGKIAFANMLDYMEIGPDGRPHLDFSALTRDQAAAIQELVVETRPDPSAVEDVDEEQEPQGHGGSLKRRRAAKADAKPAREILKVRFKLYDKQTALVNLGKNMGLFKERVEHDVGEKLRDLFAAVSGTAIRPSDGS